MLLSKGKLTYRNLNTTYTHIDQFVAGLRKERFTGYCTLSFWEYDAVLLYVAGKIINGREEMGVRAEKIRTGEAAVTNILVRGREKDGEINAYTLAADRVAMLGKASDATPKYANLSTDLTSLDRLLAISKKEALSGYIEILFEHDAGTANLFFVAGRLTEAVFAPPDDRMLGETIGLDEIVTLSQQHGAIFNVYQVADMPVKQDQGALEGDVPEEAIRLFEALLVQVESTVDNVLKPGDFQVILKKTLTQLDNTYDFLDPFLGDFRYVNGTLSYNGDAVYREFVDGMCDLINSILGSLLENLQKSVLLPRISAALESVNTRYSSLIEQLDLEARLPELFQDYAFMQESASDDVEQYTSHSLLNLQGIDAPDIGSESILREFYRVLNLIAQKYIASDGCAFQYSRFKKSSEYQQYQTATALLQNFDISLITRRDAALAFWLNVYNFLSIDGILKNGITASVQDVKGFFNKTSYRLGEHAFSLDDIEHGILRNNQRRPYSLFRPFGGGDPRQAFCINPPDPRIHCCLVCGAASSPGLRVYIPRQLQTQMAQAINQFLRAAYGMRINVETKEIWLNRSFYWYRKDFEQHGTGILDFIVEHIEATDVKQFIAQQKNQLTLRFMDYDWGLNASS